MPAQSKSLSPASVAAIAAYYAAGNKPRVIPERVTRYTPAQLNALLRGTGSRYAPKAKH